MSDVNVLIDAVDRGIDVMVGFEREIGDLRAYVNFDITSVLDMVDLEKKITEQQLYGGSSYGPDGEEEDDLRNLEEKLECLEQLLFQATERGTELNAEWARLCSLSEQHAESAKQAMGEYIRKLNLWSIGNDDIVYTDSGRSAEYRVVIVDSKKYPQTAEHIKRAQFMGFPEYVTLDRDGAADRRKASLSGLSSSNYSDRDEWPMACFAEGGHGAHIAMIDSCDNRGAGSAIGWQMRAFPDGSRVRVRVI